MADVPWLTLSCAVQQYAWGKVGGDSFVAQLSEGNPAFKLDPDSPYSELWMGTHSKGPSTIINPPSAKGKSLLGWLSDNQQALGEKVKNTFSGQLPFLFKVLSIRKPLSIQAHPTKEHAKALHERNPDKYPDDNHKPEMAIALTNFEAFCGFRPLLEIVQNLQNIPEFAAVVGKESADRLIKVCENDGSPGAKDALKACFTNFMNQKDAHIQAQLSNLVGRAEQCKDTGDIEEFDEIDGFLLLHLHSFFPGDIGCFAMYFLNYIQLTPGQAIFLAPNEPHSYIFGDCVECMACSDNVVRAGLTPKFKDKQTLCDMLTYISRPLNENLFTPVDHPQVKGIKVYDPPVPDFAVNSIHLEKEAVLPSIDGPSIFILIHGKVEISAKDKSAERLARGAVLFVPANQQLVLKGDGLLFQAFCVP